MKLNLSLHLLFVVMTFNPNVVDATDESSPGLRGRSLMTRDHFSNDDITINSPISYELLNFNEEAQIVNKLELQEAFEAEYEYDVIEVLASTVINEAGLRSTEVVDEDVVTDVDFFHDLY